MEDMGPRPPGAVRRGVMPPQRPRVRPGRIVLALTFVGSLALIAYGFLRRDAAQIPIMAAGLVVLGLTLLTVGLWGALSAYADARAGYSGRAFAEALLGGLLFLGGSVALASALVLSLIWQSA